MKIYDKFLSLFDYFAFYFYFWGRPRWCNLTNIYFLFLLQPLTFVALPISLNTQMLAHTRGRQSLSYSVTRGGWWPHDRVKVLTRSLVAIEAELILLGVSWGCLTWRPITNMQGIIQSKLTYFFSNTRQDNEEGHEERDEDNAECNGWHVTRHGRTVGAVVKGRSTVVTKCIEPTFHVVAICVAPSCSWITAHLSTCCLKKKRTSFLFQLISLNWTIKIETDGYTFVKVVTAIYRWNVAIL